MLEVQSILETSLYVDDLGASEAFYRMLFSWPTKMADSRMRALAVSRQHVLLLFARGQSQKGEDTPRGHIPGHHGTGTQHVAFAVSDDSVEAWRTHLVAKGVEIISHVRPEQGGDSLYFRDPDGHLIELATPRIWNV